MIYPYFKSEELADVVDDSLVSTALVFIFMSIIVYSQPSFFSGTYNYVMPGLIVGLFAIIIVSLFNIFFTKDMEMYRKSSIYISYIVILLFSLFVSYDTSKMFEMAKICVNYPKLLIFFCLMKSTKSQHLFSWIFLLLDIFFPFQ